MGFLRFLNRRSGDDGRSDRSYGLYKGRPVLTTSVTSLRSSHAPSVSGSVPGSLSRAQGHVDILDAQGGIRPLDFRSRVRATGIRDYGEDVAERNMGENSVDIQSAAAREFYERKSHCSTQSPSTARRDREANRRSVYADTTCGSTKTDGVSLSENWTPKRPSSTCSKEPGREGSGVFGGRPVYSPSSSVRQHRRAEQAVPTDRQTFPVRFGPSRSVNESRMSIGRPVSVAGRSRTPQSPQISSRLRSRSVSPPCVPRYRPQSSISTRPGDGSSPTVTSQRGDKPGRRAASGIGLSSWAGVSPPKSSREEPPHRRLDRLDYTGGDFEFDFGVSVPSPARAAKPPLESVVPPVDQPEWHDIVRRAVEESLAQLPLSVDLRALLEMTQNGLIVDGGLTQKISMRRMSLCQESMMYGSTPTTPEFSDAASSNAGYPRSPHTVTTSIDSFAMADLCLKAGPRILDGRSSAGDDYQSFPTIAEADVYHELDEHTKQSGSDASYHPSVLGIDHPECHPSDFSDVDSFIEKQRKSSNESEVSFLGDGFGDLNTDLPGLVASQPPKECVICNVLGSLHGNSAPNGPCEHGSTMSQKQRLRALGYDYESDESDMASSKPAVVKSGRTKKLTSGSGGGLRRLKLVDDRIEEASEEERTGADEPKRPHAVRRKPKIERFGRVTLPAIVVREDGNVADMEWDETRQDKLCLFDQV